MKIMRNDMIETNDYLIDDSGKLIESDIEEGTFIIPREVNTIGRKSIVFAFCPEHIIIPDTVHTIEDRAFYFCRNLESIVIPESVKIIGDDIAYNCPKLKCVWTSNPIIIKYFNKRYNIYHRDIIKETKGIDLPKVFVGLMVDKNNKVINE